MERPNKESLAHRYFFTKGSRASDEYDQYWIRYRPMRALRKRYGHWSRFEPVVRIVLALALVALVFVYGQVNLWLVLLAFFAIAFAARAHYLLFPTHVALTE
ncbi:MAG TPA: hypothetical protein V6D17_12090, partial [Candidatus Obscuribacterales bacterium]